jgi:hypothetical protein
LFHTLERAEHDGKMSGALQVCNDGKLTPGRFLDFHAAAVQVRMLPMSIRRVVPNIKAKPFEESRAFYIDSLGFKVGMDMGSIVTLVSPSNPTAQISLLRDEGKEGVLPYAQRIAARLPAGTWQRLNAGGTSSPKLGRQK